MKDGLQGCLVGSSGSGVGGGMGHPEFQPPRVAIGQLAPLPPQWPGTSQQQWSSSPGRRGGGSLSFSFDFHAGTSSPGAYGHLG